MAVNTNYTNTNIYSFKYHSIDSIQNKIITMHLDAPAPSLGYIYMKFSPNNLRWDSQENYKNRIEMVQYPQARTILKYHEDSHYTNS